MSDLDEKLQDIDIHVGDDGYGEDVFRSLSDDEIEQIKQAFKDAGWLDTKKPITGDIHGVGVYEVVADFSNGKLSSLMTGQEWYDRFHIELNDLIGDVYPINKISVKVPAIETIAKKAAGIEQ